MAWIGQRRRGLVGAALGVLAACVPAVAMWGFTVDDALIPVRYARHLAAGQGYRFNLPGPVTDGVTPLPWAFLLTPFARGDAPDVLLRAKCIGLAAWLAAAAALGAAILRVQAPRAAKLVAFATLALCVPVAAHAVSGMETALAIALATFAAISAERPMRAAALAGFAASLRPEMAPWAVVMGGGLALIRAPSGGRPAFSGISGAHTGRTHARAAAAIGIAVAPFVACAVVRFFVFGRAAPLSLLAKPSDLAHGVFYTASAVLVAGGALLVFAPFALRRAPKAARVLVLAGCGHVAAVAIAGGDWMPFARLVAPIVPSLVYASVLMAPHARGWASASRAVMALALEAYVVFVVAPGWRHTMRDREALIAAARPWLAGARSVATLDAGWPSAATERAIVDLAGVTDPEIAALPGGHTSKRVDAPLLLSRDPDVLLLYARADLDAANLDGWPGAMYERVLEARLARSELVQTHFEPRAFLPLGSRGAGYVVLARRR